MYDVIMNRKEFLGLTVNKGEDCVVEEIAKRTDGLEPPYPVWDKDKAIESFNELKRLNCNSLIKFGNVNAKKEDGLPPCSGIYITINNAGLLFPAFFTQEFRWKAHAKRDKNSAYEIWYNRDLRKKAIRRLYTLGYEEADRSSLRACVRMNTQLPAQFQPSVAKLIYDFFCPKDGIVLDQSMGWGDRLTGFLASKTAKKYIGTDPNKDLHPAYREIVETANVKGKETEFHCCGSEDYFDIFEEIDLAFTSPPYFDTEIYSNDSSQSCFKFPEYEKWINGFLLKSADNAINMLSKNGVYAVNINNTPVMPDGVQRLHKYLAERLNYAGRIDMQIHERQAKKSKVSNLVRTEPIFIYSKKPINLRSVLGIGNPLF